jgi:ABC-type lipoprotein release transport system permease subunit
VRYGTNYDLQFGNGSESLSPKLREILDADADVAGLMLYAPGQSRVGPATLRLIGMELVRGDIAPRLVAGRLPVDKHEIALGRLAANALGVGVGGDVSLDGENVTRKFHVTGLAVVPSVGLNDGIGQDGLLTMPGLTQLDPAATANTAVVTLRPGAGPNTAERLSALTGVQASGSSLPSAIVNVARIRSIPFVLAAFLGALALLTVVYVMLSSVQSRRKDVAILRSIGADRGWIARAVHWQATTFTVPPVVIGIPLGLIIGRSVFSSFADSIGTLNDPSFPVLLVALIAGGLVVLANAIAAVPAYRANRLAPARLLQTE